MSVGGVSFQNMHHPWRSLREREDIILHWADLPAPLHAVTDGTTVWMHDRLLQTERRCAIAHELTHIERGTRCVDDAEEQRVRRITAQRLIDTADLIEACKWANSVEEAADELWVTPAVLIDRLTGLSPVERAMIDTAVRTAWHQEGH